jgi:hypothetical protein
MEDHLIIKNLEMVEALLSPKDLPIEYFYSINVSKSEITLQGNYKADIANVINAEVAKMTVDSCGYVTASTIYNDIRIVIILT